MFKFLFFTFVYIDFMIAICGDVSGKRDEDAVVTTALAARSSDALTLTSNDAAGKPRQKRQYGTNYPFFPPSACITNRGIVGRCLTLKQCYPFFKLSVYSQYYDNLMLNMHDACTFVTPSGKQNVGGICCGDYRYVNPNEISLYPHPFYPDPDSEQIPFVDSPFPPPNWPPPLPTHPPDHTIPPLPTHPTRPTYPTTSTTTTAKPSTVKWPPPLPTHPTRPTYPTTSTTTTAKPSTVKWPPPLPTKPSRPGAATTWPTVPSTRPSTPAFDAEDLPWSMPECGIKNGYQDQERIVGGHNADPGEWPWMVAILTSGRLFCGGSLIDKVHVLTAAHCVAHMNPWDVARLRINLGDHNIKSKGDVQHIERKVKKVVRHRGFDPQTLYNDIALLTLDAPVTFSKNVRPVCLPQTRTVYSGRMATVIGWGSLREMGPTPGVLQEVNIPIWTNQECKSKYGSAAPGGIVESFLCAGKASKDSCSGDSGGPLMINDGKWHQIGIVSWGIGCGKGQYPGVYTRITAFMPWINKNLNT